MLQPDEFDLALVPLDGVAAAPLPGNSAIVVLDTETTPELEAEGHARDLVRLVQQERRDRDLDVTDRISLTVSSSRAELANRSWTGHFDWIKQPGAGRRTSRLGVRPAGIEARSAATTCRSTSRWCESGLLTG